MRAVDKLKSHLFAVCSLNSSRLSLREGNFVCFLSKYILCQIGDICTRALVAVAYYAGGRRFDSENATMDWIVQIECAIRRRGNLHVSDSETCNHELVWFPY